jgi:hypothetical protein
MTCKEEILEICRVLEGNRSIQAVVTKALMVLADRIDRLEADANRAILNSNAR